MRKVWVSFAAILAVIFMGIKVSDAVEQWQVARVATLEQQVEILKIKLKEFEEEERLRQNGTNPLDRPIKDLRQVTKTDSSGTQVSQLILQEDSLATVDDVAAALLAKSNFTNQAEAIRVFVEVPEARPIPSLTRKKDILTIEFGLEKKGWPQGSPGKPIEQ